MANKEYYQKNKEHIKQKAKEYRKKNGDKHKIKSHLRQTQTQKLQYRFKYAGIKTENWDFLINKYQTIECCELCNVILSRDNKTNKRICLDHDHNSGYARFICCQKCNGFLGKRDNIKDKLHLELYRYFNRN